MQRWLAEIVRRIYGVAHRVGQLTQPLAGPDWRVVQSVLPACNRDQARNLARSMAGRRIANGFLKRAALWFGHKRMVGLVDIEGERHLRDLLNHGVPIVLAPWHFGPMTVIGTAMIKLDVPLLVLQRWPRKTRGDGLEYLQFEGSTATRIKALRHGVETLRGGGVAMTVVDVPDNQPRDTPGPYNVLGRAVYLLQSAATLARMGQAAILPVTAHWNSGRLIVRFSPPAILPDEMLTEPEIQNALAAWWSCQIAAEPEELWSLSLEALERAPQVKPTS